MKIFIFLISLLFMQNAYAHEEHFTSNSLGYDHVRSLCASGGDAFRASSLLCSDLRAHELAHSRTSNIGGFEIIFGGDSVLQLGGDVLYNALASIFLVIFSIIAIMIGFRKLSTMFRSEGGWQMDDDGMNHYPAPDKPNPNDYDNHGNRLDKENDNART